MKDDSFPIGSIKVEKIQTEWFVGIQYRIHDTANMTYLATSNKRRLPGDVYYASKYTSRKNGWHQEILVPEEWEENG